jgi:hypothetical protein
VFSASSASLRRRRCRSNNPHAHSQIDEEKETAICATCGRVKIEIEFINNRIFRSCINAGKVPLETKKNQREAKIGKAHETI